MLRHPRQLTFPLHPSPLSGGALHQCVAGEQQVQGRCAGEQLLRTRSSSPPPVQSYLHPVRKG